MTEEDREYFLGRFEGNRECELEEMIHMEVEQEEEEAAILNHTCPQALLASEQ